MATRTSHVDVCAIQFESRATVIEMSSFPVIGRVTRGAVASQTGMMRIIELVAGKAIPRRRLQGGQRMLGLVALRTGNLCMFPRQRKGKHGVVEIIAEAIAAVMTVQTGLAKGDGVVDHERHIDLAVTLTTGDLIEGRDVIMMAIHAKERLLLRRKRMAVQ
jgi:hypothetical protein